MRVHCCTKYKNSQHILLTICNTLINPIYFMNLLLGLPHLFYGFYHYDQTVSDKKYYQRNVKLLAFRHFHIFALKIKPLKELCAFTQVFVPPPPPPSR